jgi:probable F420-dependent oxidoreductase
VRFGLTIFPTDYAIDPARLGRAAEDAGFEALFFAEHTHIPVSRETPRPGGGELPRRYWHTIDPFVALTAVATVTERLRVGTGICLVVERDPIVTAKEVASIDLLSGGRFEFGVGAGWNREEMRNHGTDPDRRFGLMRERIEAMKAIWTQDEASYAGEHVAFERIMSYPKPAQRPHPPILVGGDGPTVEDRVLAFGDAWFPNYRGDAGILQRARDLLARAERPIEVHMLGVPADAAEIERVHEAGARRAVRWLRSGSRSVVEAELERWEAAIADFNGNA